MCSQFLLAKEPDNIGIKIVKNNEGYEINYEYPSVRIINSLNRYWSIQFISFYKDEEFLGSYLIFRDPTKEFPSKSQIKVPHDIKNFNKIQVQEDHWRVGTLLSQATKDIVSKAFNDFTPIWISKSNYYPNSEEELRKSSHKQRIYLTQIKTLPDYWPWFRRAIPIGVARNWKGSVRTTYTKH